MKQVLQNIKTGELKVEQVPSPAVMPGHLLIANQASLVSAGTEKMIIDLAKKSLLGKARERPDHVRRVLEKVRNEGLFNTIQQVRRKLDEPMTMGYSSMGVVLACGAGVQHYKPGDRVASNGPHAEVVSVPQNLCGRVPDNVDNPCASFSIVGSIALHGLRMAKCTLGETVVVIGLGLIGQISVLLAKAAGLIVIGTDPDPEKCRLAKKLGADIAHTKLDSQVVLSATGQHGADACLITASTKSNQPIKLASDAVRKRGRIVLVGVVGLELDRRDFYFKESEFVVSCSYGPGRYDVGYEQRGNDYPIQHARWTEQRNIQAFLDMLGRGAIDVRPLLSHRFEFDQAEAAYELIQQNTEPYIGVVLEYPPIGDTRPGQTVQITSPRPQSDLQRMGVLGAGNFARMVLLPAIQKCNVFEPTTICSGKGVSATQIAKEYGFEKAATEEEAIFDDDSISTVFAITRHDLHAKQVIRAIETGKSIFVEKPLCLSCQELREIDRAIEKAADRCPAIMVGFNRRFSPAAKQLQEFLGDSTEPLTCAIRFNAGEIPADHWTQHDAEGGGRLIGEACHAIDLASYLHGSVPVRIFCESVAREHPGEISDDQCFMTLRHANGGITSIAYLAGGDKSFPKERVEVIGGGKVGVIDDFRQVSLTAQGKTRILKSTMDKGHHEEVKVWGKALRAGKASPIDWSSLRATTLASIGAVLSLREGRPVDLSELEIAPRPVDVPESVEAN